ncbi:MAG: MarR family transcriptional regulator [Micrococcales bacterium]|nr:MarR family transcriptional regulator [Micrococcales bacterium]
MIPQFFTPQDQWLDQVGEVLHTGSQVAKVPRLTIEESLTEYQTDVVTNVVTNVATKHQVLGLIRRQPEITAARVAAQLGVSSRQVQRIIKDWKDKGTLVRQGSLKAGRWIVVEVNDE